VGISWVPYLFRREGKGKGRCMDMSDQVSSISVCQAGFGTAVYRSAVPFQFPFFLGRCCRAWWDGWVSRDNGFGYV
jgi:hypothetical protein